MILNDETLGAYLDGELDAEAAGRVEAELATDEAARARLAAIEEVGALARAAFAEVIREPLPQRLLDAAAPPTGAAVEERERLWWLSPAAFAALAMMLVVGIGIGVLFFPARTTMPLADWRQAVAAFHVAYADTDTQGGRMLLDVGAEEVQTLSRWFGRVIGARFRAPNLEQQGMKLLGGRLLISDHQPVGQLLYRAADQRLLSFSTAREEGAPVAPAFRDVGGQRMLSWRQRGYGYALVGDFGRDRLQTIARQIDSDLR